MYNIIGDNIYLVVNEINIPLELIYRKLLYLQKDNSSNSETFTYEKTEILLKFIESKAEDEQNQLKQIKFELNNEEYSIYEKYKIKFIIEGKEKTLNLYSPDIFMNYIATNYEEKKLLFYDKNDKLISSNYAIGEFFSISKVMDSKIEESEDKISKFTAFFDQYYSQNNLPEAKKLNMNFQYYSGADINTFKYVNNKERKNLIERINKLLYKNQKIYITGISGIGKTITLLYFLKHKRNTFLTCYFNIKSLLFNQDIKLETEIISLFPKNKKEEYLKFIEQFKKNKSINPWINIKYILDNIPIFINRYYIIVFDQYKYSEDENKVLEIILNMEKFSNFNFIICSSMNDKDAKINVLYKNFSNPLSKNIEVIYLNALFSVESLIEKDTVFYKLMKKFNFSCKIYEEFIKNYNKDNINDIKKYFSDKYISLTDQIKIYFEIRKINIIENYELLIESINKEEIDEISFKKIAQIMPLKYVGYIEINLKYKFIPSFDFFELSLRDIYKKALKSKLIEFIKIIPNNSRAQLGNIFDLLVNWNFDINKPAFGSLIHHVLILNEIARFTKIKNVITYLERDEKNLFNEYELNLSQIFDGKLIYLEQYNFNGAYLDGGFLKPVNESNNLIFDFFGYQSSILKREHFNKIFLFILMNSIKEKFNEIFKIIIRKAYFFYILDPGDKITIKFCKNNGLYYILYDINKLEFILEGQKKVEDIIENPKNSMEILEPNIYEIQQYEEEQKYLKFKNYLNNYHLSMKKNEINQKGKIIENKNISNRTDSINNKILVNDNIFKINNSDSDTINTQSEEKNETINIREEIENNCQEGNINDNKNQKIIFKKKKDNFFYPINLLNKKRGNANQNEEENENEYGEKIQDEVTKFINKIKENCTLFSLQKNKNNQRETNEKINIWNDITDSWKLIFPEYKRYKLLIRNLNFRFFNESLPFFIYDPEKNIIIFKKEKNENAEYYNSLDGKKLDILHAQEYILKDKYVHIYQLQLN